MTFSVEQIKMLAECERQFDSGEMFYVTYDGGRTAVDDDLAVELGLVRGQTVSHAIFEAILQGHLAMIQAAIALDKAATS